MLSKKTRLKLERSIRRYMVPPTIAFGCSSIMSFHLEAHLDKRKWRREAR